MTDADDGPVLVPTDQAAHALRMPAPRLEAWADRGLVTPAVTDPDGEHWWNLHDLRRQLAAYLDDDEP